MKQKYDQLFIHHGVSSGKHLIGSGWAYFFTMTVILFLLCFLLFLVDKIINVRNNISSPALIRKYLFLIQLCYFRSFCSYLSEKAKCVNYMKI